MRNIETPADLLALKVECIKQVKWYVNKCADKLGIIMPVPQVVFALKGTTAGRAYYQKNLISFSPSLLYANADHFLEQTVGHEVAHLAAFRKHGSIIKPHGTHWQAVMWGLGLPATRCHNYDISGVPTQLGKVANKVIPIKIDGGIVRATTFGKVTEFEE